MEILRSGAAVQAGGRPTFYYEQARPEVAELVPPECCRVLEVGCAGGELGRLLRSRGHHVTGLELVHEKAEQARHRLDRVLTADVEMDGFPFPPASFDAIIFADVLEHMVNPHQVLLAMRPKLEPDRGIVVASIPNVRHWMVLEQLVLRGRWGYAERGLLDSGHLRFFTLHTIETMFQWAGYRIHVADVVGVAPRILWRVDRIMAGKLRPLIVYQ